MAAGPQLDGHVAVLQAVVHLGDHQVDDAEDLLPLQLVEDDGVVHAVEELGPEVLLQLLLDLGLHPVVGALGLARPGEPDGHALGDVPGAEVGRHDDDRVLEVDHPALGVGQAAVFKDLQQRVEDVRVGLLDLVEQDHRERHAGAPSR